MVGYGALLQLSNVEESSDEESGPTEMKDAVITKVRTRVALLNGDAAVLSTGTGPHRNAMVVFEHEQKQLEAEQRAAKKQSEIAEEFEFDESGGLSNSTGSWDFTSASLCCENS